MSIRDTLGSLAEEERFAHGGNLRKLAEKAGCSTDDLLDFSANLNPLGPPQWLRRELANCAPSICRYPDPDSSEVTLAACERYQVWPTEAVAGNGASELLLTAARLFPCKQAVVPVPAYVDYVRVSELASLKVKTLEMNPADNFSLDLDALDRVLEEPALVFLANPNNPTGQAFDVERFKALARKRSESWFIVDESFADFDPSLPRLTGQGRPPNVVVILSLTKFYAIPGLRAGLAFAAPDLAVKIKSALPSWPVNLPAQRVAARCLRDADYAEQTETMVQELRDSLYKGLSDLPGIRVLPSRANFLLCRCDRVGMSAVDLQEQLLSRHNIAIRSCSNFQGLDETWFRVAVKNRAENERLLEALGESSGLKTSPKKTSKPAVMVQATSSNSGKSVLTAALCRIFLQDGLRPVPFKAQNMSLNSYVTLDGKEIGRAQALQAMACRLEPDTRMNPILLKPGSDTGSQVIVLGKPVGNMDVIRYTEEKKKLFPRVVEAYESLVQEADVAVIEGAGSPAEINLKAHDIVNMAMAEAADASVILAGDIDRGGVFAALMGTMDLLPDSEQRRILGLVINKFRGDASLLAPGLRTLEQSTGKPVLGVVPHIEDLGLPEEDSVSFKDLRPLGDKPGAEVDVVLIDLPRISNFTDADPLALEPDVSVRVVRDPGRLGSPDAVIIPGSKNTMSDLAWLRRTGLADRILDLPDTVRIVGLCGGLQIIGLYISDPYDVEYGGDPTEGLGLLPIQTFMAEEKTLVRGEGVHEDSGLTVSGYEIHHGQTDPLLEEARPDFRTPDGRTAGFSHQSGRAWGTYLHGVFDNDEFRRWFVDDLRTAKGLAPLGSVQTTFDLEPALNRLADVVRQALDMDRIYKSMGF